MLVEDWFEFIPALSPTSMGERFMRSRIDPGSGWNELQHFVVCCSEITVPCGGISGTFRRPKQGPDAAAL